MKTLASVIAVSIVLSIGGMLLLKTNASRSTPQSIENAPTASASRDLKRIVATDGAITEIVYALGFGDRIVGADITAEWPPSVKQKPSIGYVRRISSEGVLSLAPTLILNNAEAGPAEAIQQLRKSGVSVYEVAGDKESRSFATISKRILSVADALGVPEKGRELSAAVEDDVASARSVASGRTGPRTLFLFNPSESTLLAAGRNTEPDEFMRVLNLQNVAGTLENWKPLSPEAIVAAAPEFLVIATRKTNPTFDTAADLLTSACLTQTPAGKNKRVAFVGLGKYLAGGPRSGATVLEFSKLAYPDAEIPESRSDPLFHAIEKLFPAEKK